MTSIATKTNPERHTIHIPSPIHIFSVEDFGIPLERFLQETRPIFYDLPWDPYDARREQLEFLQKHISVPESDFQTFCDYFEGKTPFTPLQRLRHLLSLSQRAQFDLMKPFRRRAISKFVGTFSSPMWNFKRVPISRFSQDTAKLKEKKFDFRTLVRTFTEIEDRHIETPLFKMLLQGIAEKVRKFNPEITSLEISAHHVLVETYRDRIKSNSPEGIHQDGFDYIVSALVIERHEVLGGESQVFSNDKLTQLCTTTLMPGFGLLQPDQNTSLWHQVTPITVKDPSLQGFRSSIGFDIALCREKS